MQITHSLLFKVLLLLELLFFRFDFSNLGTFFFVHNLSSFFFTKNLHKMGKTLKNMLKSRKIKESFA